MGFTDRLKGAATGLLMGANMINKRLDSERVMRELYAGNDTAIVPGNVYVLNSTAADGRAIGFLWACVCAVSYTILGQFEVLRDYKCRCGEKLDFLKRTGLADKNGTLLYEPHQWESVLAAKLKHRPHFTAPQMSPVVDTWSDNGGSDVIWEGSTPKAGV